MSPASTDRDLAMLRRVIKGSGKSTRVYAHEVLIREDRTVRRWLSGDSPIPKKVLAFLKQENQRLRDG